MLEDDLLLGQEVVGEGPVQVPELVEDRKLGVSVEVELTNQFPDLGPALLFDVGPVVLVARPVTG